MRYSISSKTIDPSQVEAMVVEVGGKNIKKTVAIRQIFCELTEQQVELLATNSELKVRGVQAMRPTQQLLVPPMAEVVTEEESFSIADVFRPFRDSFTPSITGEGLTIAVLDSGIRSTHESLVGKVIAEENFSDAPNCSDVYNHGTGVAFLIAGSDPGNAKTGVAPGAKLINIKVLGVLTSGGLDISSGTDEMVAEGIDYVCTMVTQAIVNGLLPSDPEYPNVINISLGADDDGDSDNPVRLACKVAVEEYGLQIVAAAGNDGDRPETIMIPACDALVVAVGGMQTEDMVIWPYSSRGPTKEGLIKPDFVAWATNLIVASSASNDSYATKSGTSFAAPLLSGLIGLIWELGRRNYGEAWRVTWYDVESVGEFVCVKPESEPYVKDNTWGFGLPAPSLMARGAEPQPVETTNVMSMMMMMMMMGVMTPVMGGA